MRRIGGAFLAATGVLACPCHLVITLPLLTALFAGTVVGNALTQHRDLVYTAATIYFVAALVLLYWFLLSPGPPKGKEKATCPECQPETAEIRERETGLVIPAEQNGKGSGA